MVKWLPTVALILLFCQAAAKSTTELAGKVIDKSNGQELAGANVMLENLGIGTSTNRQGEFSFADIPSGPLVLSVSYIGYEVYKRRIIIPTAESPLEIALVLTSLPGQQITITATRAVERETPVAFSSMNQKQIRQAYYGQDIPMLVAELPNVYAYSDAGTGFGYSTLKVRGFDQSRVGVMINGIPLNDPEDHQVYWVDMPDLAESIADIQIQRGVSNSLFGISAFGGSVNLITANQINQKGITAKLSIGSYGTRRTSFSMSSGLIDNTYSISGRFSRILSDGYRENSGIDFWSYFLSATRFGAQSTLKLNVYGGSELTHAAWDGVHQDILAVNRRANPTSSGYNNNIDRFFQPHYEVIHEIRLSPTLTLSNSFFVIQGEGYYELYKNNRSLFDFGMQSYQTSDPTLFGEDSLDYYATVEGTDTDRLARQNGHYTVLRTDLVNQKWVEKTQLGVLPRLQWLHSRGLVVVGGHMERFNSRHYGKVIWAKALASASQANPNEPYYRYAGKKWTGALYLHSRYQLKPSISAIADLQYQSKNYDFNHHQAGNFAGADLHAFSLRYRFLNPKIGLHANLSRNWDFFSSISFSQREPTDKDHYDAWEGPDDLGAAPLFAERRLVWQNNAIVRSEFSGPQVKPEKLIDYELGIGYSVENLQCKANAYWMNFKNEIIASGQVNDDGQPIRGNADRSIHRGLEFSLFSQPFDRLVLTANYSFSQNYYEKFIVQGTDENWMVVPIDLSGNTIPLFPNRLGNLRMTFTQSFFRASVHWQSIGRQYLDSHERMERSLPPYSLINLSCEFDLSRWVSFPGLSIGFQIVNAADQDYYASGYYDEWSNANYYFPAAPRQYFTQATINF